jgi:hypothetical protein
MTQMLIGQSFTRFSKEELEKLFGGWNSCPLNIEKATANDFNTLLMRDHGFTVLQRQPYVDGKLWIERREIVPVTSYHPGTSLLSNVKLFVAPDLSGIMAVFITGWSNVYKDQHFEPFFFKFQQCLHEVETVQTGRCLTRSTCKLCGFSTEVDSGD